MPMQDGSGPQGFGPRTGRGYGPCGWGTGFGPHRGYGRGLGRYFGWNPPQTQADQIKETQMYLTALKEEVEEVEKHLADLQRSE